MHLYSIFLTSGHSKRLKIVPNICPFMRTFTHRRRCHPCKATAGSSGAVRVSCLAQRHLNNRVRGAGDRTSNLEVTNQPAPEPHAAPRMLKGSWRTLGIQPTNIETNTSGSMQNLYFKLPVVSPDSVCSLTASCPEAPPTSTQPGTQGLASAA